MSVRIVFYTKPYCPLCVETEELLEGIAGRLDISVLKIDITADMEIFDKFKHRIPVLKLGDDVELEGRISEKELIRTIRALLKKAK